MLLAVSSQYEAAHGKMPVAGSVTKKETNDMAAERKSEDYFRTENGEKGGHVGTKSEKVPRLHETRSMKKEVLNE